MFCVTAIRIGNASDAEKKSVFSARAFTSHYFGIVHARYHSYSFFLNFFPCLWKMGLFSTVTFSSACFFFFFFFSFDSQFLRKKWFKLIWWKMLCLIDQYCWSFVSQQTLRMFAHQSSSLTSSFKDSNRSASKVSLDFNAYASDVIVIYITN